jgi:hypothetical protein
VNALNRSWLRAVRISAFCIFLVIFIVMVRMYASLLTHYDPEDSTSSRLQWAFPPALLFVPYFWVFWRLRDISDAKRVKKALAVAVNWGSLGSLGALAATVRTWNEKDWLGTVMFSIFALLQFVLLGSAIKIYYGTERKPGDLLILGTPFGIIVLIAVLFAQVIPSSSFLHMEHIEASGADALRSINTAQIEYAKRHRDKGFASSLEELGPPPGAGLIDENLAKGWRYKYWITLTPPSPDGSGHTSRYTLTARPIPYGSRVRRSFFCDESGVIHYTAADRAPTVHDRVLP